MHSGVAIPNAWKAHPRAEGSVPQKQLTSRQVLTEYPLTVILSTGQGAGCYGLKPLIHSKCPRKTAAAELVEHSALLICMEVQRVQLHRPQT